MIIGTALVILALVLLGRVWARLPMAAGRALSWLALLAVLAGLERLHAGAGPVFRMVVLCCGLLAGLKAVVYVEWSGRGRRVLSWSRFLGFGLLWFGMDPTPFAGTRRKLGWMGDLRAGLAGMAAGLLLALAVRAFDWTAWVLPVFVPMSIGFHYGALRLLTAGWRAWGLPVRVLFRNPLPATSLAEFWARRWNLGYSEMMVRVVKRPLAPLVGRRAGDFAVFLVSGLLHEVAITVPVGAGFGWPTLYFAGHGLLVQVERARWPRWLRHVWTLCWVAAPLGILFPPAFFDRVILRFLEVLPKIEPAWAN